MSISAYFFDLGGTLVELDNDEILLDAQGRVSLLANVTTRFEELRGQPIFVVTNQAGIALGTLTAAQAEGFMDQVNQQVRGAIIDYRICMHHPNAGCLCRKPQPGMLLDLGAAHGIDLAQAVMIGDSSNDEQCALTAGVGTFIWADDFFGRSDLPQAR